MSTTTKTVKVGGAKNGQTRTVVVPKTPRQFVLEEAKRPLKTRKVSRPAKLRDSITPGTVLILLAGRFRGKRVVCLKQLASGLLLVTGPYKVNGVPLKRVNQAYVIATSTKVDISSVKLNEKLDDALFQKEKAAKGEFFGEKATEAKGVSAARKALQSELDAQLVPVVNKTPMLKSYLGSHFSLKKGQYPHQMSF